MPTQGHRGPRAGSGFARRVCVAAIASAAVALGGCANFDTIRAFAKDGSTVAAAAKKDVDIFRTACADLQAEAAVLAYANGAASAAASGSRACSNVVVGVQAAAESLSVQLLVKYHEALNALAGDENWSLTPEIEALGAEVKKLKADGKTLATAADVDRYQKAFVAIADLVTSALRERAARRLLSQELDWNEVLRPLRFWYGGSDGRSVSFYSQACRIVRTDWTLVRGGLLDFARCDRKTSQGVPLCEPLTAGARLLAIDGKSKSVTACAAGSGEALPEAAAARVKLIDGWLAANDELRRSAFDKDPQALLGRLSNLREQIETIRSTFD